MTNTALTNTAHTHTALTPSEPCMAADTCRVVVPGMSSLLLIARARRAHHILAYQEQEEHEEGKSGRRWRQEGALRSPP